MVPLVVTPRGAIPVTTGASTLASAPVAALMLKAETVLELPFVTYANLPE